MQRLQSISASDLQAFLGAPEQLLEQPVELQLAVANFVDTPKSLLEVLVNSTSRQVAEAASLHVNWAGEITNDWQHVIDEILQSQQIGQNDRLVVELLKLGPVPISFFSKWVPVESLIQGLRNPHITLRYRLQLLERLAQEPTLEPRLQVAEAPETPLPILEQLAGDLELPVRLAVKFNPSCPPQLIELVEGQHAVASNWNTDVEKLAVLGQSCWAWIKLAVAQNPNADEQTLIQLAQDKIYKIQLAVAQNPNAGTEILMYLVKSEVHEIQLTVAKNIGASVDVLTFLAHQDTEIQAAVAKHRNITEEIMHQILPTQQIILEKRKNLPISILERIFHERTTKKPVWKDYYLRNLFLSQTNTPAWILAELANVDLEALRIEKREQQKQEMRFHELTAEISEKWVQDDIRFLANIAQHPQVSVEILKRLLLYPNNDVQFAVAQNSLISEHVRIQILEALVNTTEEKIIEKLAASSNTPVSILEKIALCERYQDKFQAKLRRILTRNLNEDNRESIADCFMDKIYDILIQHQASVDVEQWLTIIASYQWTTLVENYTYFGKLVGRFYEDKDFSEYLFQEWSDLLPTLTEQSLKQIISNVLKMSDVLSEIVKGERSIAVALVGNSSTPVNLREEIEERLTKPIQKLCSDDNDSDMRMALAYNPQIPKARRLQYFQELLATRHTENIASNPNTPPEIIAQIMKKGVGNRQAISKNYNAPIRLLAELAQDDDRLTRSQVAENSATTSDILVQLARQSIEKNHNGRLVIDKSVRQAAFNNPNFPLLERYKILLETEETQETANANELMARRLNSPYTIAQIVEKGDEKAKLTAAYSSKTPIYILEQLAKDADENIRLAIIENENTPSNSLIELASDRSYNIRISLARSRHVISKDISSQLLQHGDRQIRINIANNLNTPVDILTLLTQDNNRNVKVAALANPNLLSTVLSKIMPQIQDEDEIERILQGQSRTGKHNSHMPTDVLEKLSQHPKDTIRYLVATYCTTSATTLERLAFDEYELVRQKVGANPNTPYHILESFSQDENPAIRQATASNPNLPETILPQLANDEKVEVRRAVALNANTPIHIRETLSDLILQPITSQTSPALTGLSRIYNPSIDDLPTILTEYVQSENAFVRFITLLHPLTPQNILTQGAGSASWLERYAVAENPATSTQIKQQLTQDSNRIVKAAVKANLKKL